MEFLYVLKQFIYLHTVEGTVNKIPVNFTACVKTCLASEFNPLYIVFQKC